MRSCLICDDHALVREALGGMVRMGWPQACVEEVGSFTAAWEAAPQGHDLCIADLMMPGAGPIEGIEGLIRRAPTTPVLVVTGTEDDALLMRLLEIGVAGFTPKSASGGIIDAAIRLILAGGRYLPPRLAQIAAARAPDEGPPVTKSLERLTTRQVAVLKLVAEGLSNKSIALRLGIAPDHKSIR